MGLVDGLTGLRIDGVTGKLVKLRIVGISKQVNGVTYLSTRQPVNLSTGFTSNSPHSAAVAIRDGKTLCQSRKGRTPPAPWGAAAV